MNGSNYSHRHDEMTSAVWYAICIAAGVLIGSLLTLSVIDDKETFTIPFTDTTFVRVTIPTGESE